MCPFCFYFCMQIMLKTDMEDKKSLAGAWVEAARPRTLPASVSPVLLGCALAYYDGMFDITPVVLHNVIYYNTLFVICQVFF